MASHRFNRIDPDSGNARQSVGAARRHREFVGLWVTRLCAAHHESRCIGRLLALSVFVLWH